MLVRFILRKALTRSALFITAYVWNYIVADETLWLLQQPPRGAVRYSFALGVMVVGRGYTFLNLTWIPKVIDTAMLIRQVKYYKFITPEFILVHWVMLVNFYFCSYFYTDFLECHRVLMIHFNIFLPYTLRCSKCFLHLLFPKRNILCITHFTHARYMPRNSPCSKFIIILSNLIWH